MSLQLFRDKIGAVHNFELMVCCGEHRRPTSACVYVCVVCRLAAVGDPTGDPNLTVEVEKSFMPAPGSLNHSWIVLHIGVFVRGRMALPADCTGHLSHRMAE